MKLATELVAGGLTGLVVGFALRAFIGSTDGKALAQALPIHRAVQSHDGPVVIQLCDGVTSMEVKGLKPDQSMSHAQALSVTRELMDQWRRKNPGQQWEMAQADTATTRPTPESSPIAQQPGTPPTGGSEGRRNIAGPGAAAAPPIQQGDTYASFHERDSKIWQAQTDAFVEQGNQIFHSAQLLGSTIGVSCDMCHPNAANTHPETYPKYQEQLQRVALLRDMIDWCIENPVKGRTLDPNDPKMRALEAYILAQRKGIALDYGKH
jgi:hypothetical protein